MHCMKVTKHVLYLGVCVCVSSSCPFVSSFRRVVSLRVCVPYSCVVLFRRPYSCLCARKRV